MSIPRMSSYTFSEESLGARCVLRVGLAVSAPRARGTCFLCTWRTSPAKRGHRTERGISAHSETQACLRCPHLNPRGRGGSESFGRIALTRVSLVPTLGRLWTRPGRSTGASRCAFRRARNPNTGTSSVIERHRAIKGISIGEGAADGESLGFRLHFFRSASLF
jgi:hypothetical protein